MKNVTNIVGGEKKPAIAGNFSKDELIDRSIKRFSDSAVVLASDVIVVIIDDFDDLDVSPKKIEVWK